MSFSFLLLEIRLWEIYLYRKFPLILVYYVNLVPRLMPNKVFGSKDKNIFKMLDMYFYMIF